MYYYRRRNVTDPRYEDGYIKYNLVTNGGFNMQHGLVLLSQVRKVNFTNLEVGAPCDAADTGSEGTAHASNKFPPQGLLLVKNCRKTQPSNLSVILSNPQ